MRKALIAVLMCCTTALFANEMKIKVEPVRPTSRINLFNGKDFSGWTKVINADPESCPDKTWSINNGVIRCTGQPFGYLATQQSYADYKLHVEYRWYGTTDQMNSGIFFFKTGPDNFFLPKTLEAQLKQGNAGDLLLLSKATANGLENERNRVIEKSAPSSEKPQGEWNTVEIIVKGRTAEIRVNDVLQSKGFDIYADAGQICLQSEGGPIEFRNVYLDPLP